MKTSFFRDSIVFVVISAIVVLSTVFLASQRGELNFSGFWEIINADCSGCGGCAVECVVPGSAAKATMNFALCDSLDACPAFFKSVKGDFSTGIENQTCPTGALVRKDASNGKYIYSIDKKLCIGCGRCTKACQRKGEGALTLNLDPEICLDCNECSIAVTCPKGAVVRKDKSTGEDTLHIISKRTGAKNETDN